MARRRLIAGGLAAFALALPVGYAVAESEPSGPEEVPGFSELAPDEQAETRDQLTRMLSAMEYNGASEAAMAPIRERLEGLGGPDPTVPSHAQSLADRPGWLLEVQERLDKCHAGDESACQQIDREGAEMLEGFENGN